MSPYRASSPGWRGFLQGAEVCAVATNQNNPDHQSRLAPSIGRLTLDQETPFFRVTDVARMTAQAVHPCGEDISCNELRPCSKDFTCNEHAQYFAFLQTVQDHIECVHQAVMNGTLRLFDPISRTVLSPANALKTVGGGNQCMVAWDDFVAFAASLGIAVDVPVTERSSVSPARAKTVHEQQDEQVLKTIADLGYTASNLPKMIQGKAGVKSAVRAKLKLTRDAFNKTWTRLRADGQIKEEV